MATPPILPLGCVLELLSLRLAPREFADRCILVHPAFKADIDRLKSFDLGPEAVLSVSQQLHALAKNFIIGKPLEGPRQFRMLRGHPRWVWELKSIDLRVFGWPLERDCFVACRLEVIDNLKFGRKIKSDAYDYYIGEVLKIRAETGLSCVESELAHECFSGL
jgi:hypothetical protein